MKISRLQIVDIRSSLLPKILLIYSKYNTTLSLFIDALHCIGGHFQTQHFLSGQYQLCILHIHQKLISNPTVEKNL